MTKDTPGPKSRPTSRPRPKPPVTERKTAELALQNKDKQLSEALTIARIGYWEYEFSTDEFIFNDQYYLLHNITAAEAGGYQMSSADFVSRYVYPEDAPMVAKNIQWAFETRDPDYFAMTESRILSGEGEILWVEVRFIVVKDLLGNTVRLIGISQDITARKQSEQDTLDEKRFSDTLIQSLPAIFYLFDQQGNMIRWNDNLLELTGRSPAEMAAANVLDFVEEEDRSLVALKIREVFETGTASTEARIVVKDGVRLYAMNGVRIETRHGVNVIGIGIDISERMQAEFDLRWRTAFFEALMKSSTDGILVVDLNGRKILQNQRFNELLDIPENIATDPDDTPQLQYVTERVVDAKQFGDKVCYLYEHPEETSHDEVALKNGIILQRYSAPVIGSDGYSYGRIWTFHDITERKEAEQKLQYSQRLLNSIVTSAMDAIVTVNEEQYIELANPSAEKMFGYTTAEFRQLHLSSLIPERYRKVHSAHVLAFGKTDETSRKMSAYRLVTGLRKNGEEFLFEVTISKDNSTGRQFYSAFLRDITERKQSEDRIKYLNRVYAMLTEINTLIVRVRDRDKLFNEACRVAVEIGGFRLAMIYMVESALMKIVPVATVGDNEVLVNEIKNILSSGDLAENTMISRAITEKRTIVSNDSQNDPQVQFGKEYAAAGVRSIVVLPLLSGDDVAGALALYASENNIFHKEELKLLTKLVDDIAFAKDFLSAQSALYKLTEDLENKVTERTADLEKARQESDRANQAKSIFLATMSHEIRTPMNGVIGMLDVLRQTSLMEHQLEMVDLISESAFSLLEIIDDILNLSKIESGKLEFEHRPIQLVDVVEKACDLLDHLATRKGVELTLFIDPVIPEKVLGDALRLRQVLINLLSNAIKFSSGEQRRGHVSLRALLVGHGSDQVTVEFKVIDDGIGIDEATQAQLFTAFAQADTTTTRRFGGTGLGLVISRNLVELMGGEITVQSAPGKGATFSVRLPFTPAQTKPHDDDKRFDLAGLSCVVLGDQDFADDLAAYLTYGGVKVERAKGLVAAIKLIGTAPSGLWLFIIDARDDTAPIEELRTACLARDNQMDSRFMVVEHGRHQPGTEPHFVVIERGRRRYGRIQSVDLVTIDGDVMHRQSFLEAVAIAAGRAQKIEEIPPRSTGVDVITAPSREQARQQGRLILVAEDNEINQKVIRRQLELLGFASDVAVDGRKALELWESGDYGLLLTDLHMPKMDGYQLTAAIRANEAGMQRTPIIALTANALTGEAEQCHAVGMDDYLSKPARLEDLSDTLKKWLPDVVEVSAHTPVSQTASAQSTVPVDVRVIASLVGDDPEVIHEFLKDFQTSATKIAAELLVACKAGETAAAGEAAHKLKSSAFSVGAQALGELCVKIEQASNTDQKDALSTLLPHFEAEITVVNEFLETL